MADHKPPLPVGTVKATAVGTYGPTIWNNVWYFSPITPGSVIADTFNLVHDALHAFYTDCWSHNVSVHWTVSEYKIAYRDATDSIVRFTLADAIAGGIAAGQDQDAQVSFLVNLATGDPRKGGKARKYIPGVVNAAMADTARLDPGFVTARNTAMVTWLNANLTRASGGATGLLTLEMSFRNAKTWRDAAVPFEVHAVTCNPIVATQRDRVDRLR